MTELGHVDAGKWSSTEQAVLDAYIDGEEIEFGTPRRLSTGKLDLDRAQSIRASVLAQLILTPPPTKEGKTSRLRVSGAVVTGQLDLGCGKLAPFLFRHCKFEEAPNLSDASAEFVGFVHCEIPGLTAARLRCAGPIWLIGTKATGSISLEDCHVADIAASGIEVVPVRSDGHALCFCGAQVMHDADFTAAKITGGIGFQGASVAGSIVLSGASLTAERDKPALLAPVCQIGGNLRLSKLEASGEIALEGSKISGAVALGKSKISANGRALNVDHSEMRLGLHAEDVSILGMVSMHHARIGCQATFSRAKIKNPDAVAIRADHLEVEGSFLLNGDAEVEGEIDCHGAKVDCAVNLHGLKQSRAAKRSWGVNLDLASIGGDMFAREVRIADGVDMTGVALAGSIRFDNSMLDRQVPDAPAFRLRRGQVKGGIFAGRAFECVGGLDLEGGVIGTIDLSDGVIGNGKKRSIRAADLHVSQDVLLDRLDARGTLDFSGVNVTGDFRIADSRLNGTPTQAASRGVALDLQHGGTWRGSSIRLSGARIAGDVDIRGANAVGTIDVSAASVGRIVTLDGAFLSAAGNRYVFNGRDLCCQSLRFTLAQPAGGDVDLNDARIENFMDDRQSWSSDSRIDVEGLRYERLESTMSLDQRLEWLAQATPRYSSQPYQQLAQRYASVGMADESRAVKFRAARRQYRSGHLLLRFWGGLQNLIVGFGYRPGRAVVWTIASWAIGALFFKFASGNCEYGGAVHGGLCPIDPAKTGTWNPYYYAADLLIPFVNLGQDNAWKTSAWTQLVGLVLILVGWVLVTTIGTAVGRSLKSG